MSEHSWSRLQSVFERARELPAAERPAYLDEECAGEPELRLRIDALLVADSSTDRLLDGVAADCIPDLHGDLEAEGSGEPTVIVRRDYGLLSWIISGFGAAAAFWAVRDFFAWRRLRRASVVAT